ncbi:Uncharacterized protein APZ42_026801 [Daphnia magna]|uniref:Uncharacterized protein n=1 Tax=Daphnia magna TaxID=35525 RepID=A0A164RXR8_9CRUS|nr:Uncharacterized protein APZ42_026801 [Daphnia magna]
MSYGSLRAKEEITSRYRNQITAQMRTEAGEEEETGPLCGCRNLLNIVQAFHQIQPYSLSYTFLVANLPLLTGLSTKIPAFTRRNHDRQLKRLGVTTTSV